MGDLRRFGKRQENKAAAKINHEQDLLRIGMFGQKFLRHAVAHPNHAARSRHHHADRVAAQAEKFAEFVVEKHGQTHQQKHQADFLPVRKGFFNTPTPTKIMVKGESCHNTCVVVGEI